MWVLFLRIKESLGCPQDHQIGVNLKGTTVMRARIDSDRSLDQNFLYLVDPVLPSVPRIPLNRNCTEHVSETFDYVCVA